MGICCFSRSHMGVCLFCCNVAADGFYFLNTLLLMRRKKTKNLLYLISVLKSFYFKREANVFGNLRIKDSLLMLLEQYP